MSEVLFTRRDKLVEAFHASPPGPRTPRIFALIVAINARLLQRGRRETFDRMRSL